MLLYWCRYPLLVPRGLRKGKTYDRQTLARARTDTLLLGDRVVLVVFGLWVIAGIAIRFPCNSRRGTFRRARTCTSSRH